MIGFRNPRSGHFTLGPNRNDPWYKKITFHIIIGFFMGILYVMEYLNDAWEFIKGLF